MTHPLTEVPTASVFRANTEILPLLQARIEDLTAARS
jgi:hypothetical protein